MQGKYVKTSRVKVYFHQFFRSELYIGVGYMPPYIDLFPQINVHARELKNSSYNKTNKCNNVKIIFFTYNFS